MQLPQSEKEALLKLAQSERFAEAFARAEAITHQYPKAIDAWNIRGVSALKLGKVDDAETCFRTLEELAPDMPGGPYNLGHLLEGKGADEEAAKAYTRAVE